MLDRAERFTFHNDDVKRPDQTRRRRVYVRQRAWSGCVVLVCAAIRQRTNDDTLLSTQQDGEEPLQKGCKGLAHSVGVAPAILLPVRRFIPSRRRCCQSVGPSSGSRFPTRPTRRRTCRRPPWLGYGSAHLPSPHPPIHPTRNKSVAPPLDGKAGRDPASSPIQLETNRFRAMKSSYIDIVYTSSRTCQYPI